MCRVNTKLVHSYFKQADAPTYKVADALRVAIAIKEKCGGQPTPPLMVAKSMGMRPSSGGFQGLCGAAMAYGLTEGGGKAAKISLTTLGDRVASEKNENTRNKVLREAVLKPAAVKGFLEKYNGNKVPAEDVAVGLLEQELQAPKKKAQALYQLIVDNARLVGFLTDIDGQDYVHLDVGDADEPVEPATEEQVVEEPESGEQSQEPTTSAVTPQEDDSPANRDVFITHGSNMKIVEQIKKLLKLARLNPVVAVEQETTAMPIPHKIRDGMGKCMAAIIHVGTELKLRDEKGEEHLILNSNVLIEIGAAMALYEDGFILLVEEGVVLPSNLQGLSKITFKGDRLDFDSAIEVLGSLNEL